MGDDFKIFQTVMQGENISAMDQSSKMDKNSTSPTQLRHEAFSSIWKFRGNKLGLATVVDDWWLPSKALDFPHCVEGAWTFYICISVQAMNCVDLRVVMATEAS